MEIILEITVAFGSILLASAKVYVFLEGPGMRYELFLNICSICCLMWLSNLIISYIQLFFVVLLTTYRSWLLDLQQDDSCNNPH